MIFRRITSSFQSFSSIAYRAISNYKGKVFETPQDAISDMKDGAWIAVGGFGLCGVPENALLAVKDKKIKDINLVCTAAGNADSEIGFLLEGHQIKSMNASYAGENPLFEKQYFTGEITYNMIPQGTLIEMCRMSSAGIPSLYVKAGLGTVIEYGEYPTKMAKDGKSVIEILPRRERRNFDGKNYLMTQNMELDYSLVKCYKADKKGNLRFRKTARNMNPDISGAAKITIAEAEELVDELPPDQIHFPGCFVDRVYKSPKVWKKIERRKTRQPSGEKHENKPAKKSEKQEGKKDVVKDVIAIRAVQELKPGMYCNLGIGIPNLVAAHIIGKVDADLQSENGLVGVGPYPLESEVDCDLVNAGKETVSEAKGFSHNRSSDAFGIIRGGHLHMTMLGGLQVSENGDLANWIIPGAKVKGMGGAMDLVSCGSSVVVTMEHASGKNPKILKECTIPLTGKNIVTKLITEKAVFEIGQDGMVLTELGPGATVEEIKSLTSANYKVSPNLKNMEL